MTVITTRRPAHERLSLWFHGGRSTPSYLARLAVRKLYPRPSWLNVGGGAAFVWSAWQLHPVAGGAVLGVSALVANWRLTERPGRR